MTRVAWIVGALTGLLALAPAQAHPPMFPAASGTHVFPCRSEGWYWVYGAIAQGQTFIAPGSRLQGLRLRVARRGADVPQAPLEVEVREAGLRSHVLARGRIEPS